MELKVDDTVILCTSTRWTPGLPSMSKGVVQRINSASTYVQIEDSNHVIRFDNRKKKRMITSDMLTSYKIMESEEEFNQLISDIIERNDLVSKVSGTMTQVSLEGLRKMHKILESEGLAKWD